MGEDEQPADQVAEPAGWAMLLARSVILSETVATLLFIGAGLALLLGVAAAVAIAIGSSDQGSGSSYTVAQTCSTFLACLLPAGLLAASGAALRLQVSKLEADFVED
jgi:hypothetical protein